MWCLGSNPSLSAADRPCQPDQDGCPSGLWVVSKTDGRLPPAREFESLLIRHFQFSSRVSSTGSEHWPTKPGVARSNRVREAIHLYRIACGNGAAGDCKSPVLRDTPGSIPGQSTNVTMRAWPIGEAAPFQGVQAGPIPAARSTTHTPQRGSQAVEGAGLQVR